MKAIKLFFTTAIIANSILANSLRASELEVFLGPTLSMIATNRTNPNDVLITGGVYISSKGDLNIIWDPLSASLGSYSLSFVDGADINTNLQFPIVHIDMNKVFGSRWMKNFKLNLATGGYDDDITRYTTDSFIGKVTVNLTQALISNGSLSLDLNESVGVAARSYRHYRQNRNTAESLPYYFQLSSALNGKVSNNVILAISLGVNAVVMDKLNGPDETRIGGFGETELRYGKKFSLGMRGDTTRRYLYKKPTIEQDILQISGYVKRSIRRGEFQLVAGKILDESIPINGDGNTLDNNFVKVIYSLKLR